MYIFANSKRRSNQKVESIVGEVDADIGSAVFHVAALLYAKPIQNLLVYFANARYLSYGQFIHEFEDRCLITLKISLTVWLIHI